MSRIKNPTAIERMDAAERIGNTIKALEAGTFGKAQIKSKHTPGPWAVDLDREFALDGDVVEVEATDESGEAVRRFICSCPLETTDWPNSPEAQEDAANARLIALAPEMFDVLSKILARMDDDNWDAEKVMRERVRAILSKLTCT